jgi:hypothetical protein
MRTSISFHINDPVNGPIWLVQAPFTPALNQWYHLAVTRNATLNLYTIYVNGVPVGSQTNTRFIHKPNAPLTIGEAEGLGYMNGLLDEVSIYNRVLLANEIQAIYNAGSSGKAPLPPAIISGLQNQTATVGNNAVLNMVAQGSGLSYQWTCNGTTIPLANGSQLVLNSVQMSDAGTYVVTVSSSLGSVSSSATLTVNPAVCTAVPEGLVGWWEAEGNADDVEGWNNGTLTGNATYGQGEVGQGFVLVDDGDAVQLPDNGGLLQMQNNFTIEAWVQRADPSYINTDGDGWGMVFSYGSGGYGFGMDDSGDLFLTQQDYSEVSVSTGIQDTSFHHVAVTVTVDSHASPLLRTPSCNSRVTFYVDGKAYPAGNYNPGYTFSTLPAIGSRVDQQSYTLNGTIDEVSVYSQALSAGQIQAIYNAASAGKCPLPPQIISALEVTPPTATVGNSVILNVVAQGSDLNYQWTLNVIRFP